MTNHLRYGVVALAALMPAMLPLQAAGGAEIPPRLDQRPAPEGIQGAAEKAAVLDQAELAELARSDPSQRGGDAIVTIVVIAAVVFLVYILMEHMDHVK